MKFKVGDKVVCKHPVIVCDDFTDVVGVVVDTSSLSAMDTGEQVITIDYDGCEQGAYVDTDGVEYAEDTRMKFKVGDKVIDNGGLPDYNCGHVGEVVGNYIKVVFPHNDCTWEYLEHEITHYRYNEQIENPEMGSKWVALEDNIESANVNKGEEVTVIDNSGGIIRYRTNRSKLSWVANEKDWHNNFKQQKAPDTEASEVTEGYDLSDHFDDQVNSPSYYGQGSINSDGGPSKYYDFQDGWVTWNDLADYKAQRQWKEHAFHLGNVGKAIYRWGEKGGTTKTYDAKKIIYSGLRVLLMLEGKTFVRKYLEDLLQDRQFRD